MTTFEIVIIMSAACGLAMVIGGIWLLAKGTITLAATPQTDALTLEWKKQFRIHTQVPGIAFFLIGALFVFLSLHYSEPPGVAPIEFHGQLNGIKEPAIVLINPNSKWQIQTTSSGLIQGLIYPDLSMLALEAQAPGYEPLTTVVSLKSRGSRLADIGTLELKKKIQEIVATESNIDHIDFAPPAPGAGGRAAFGVAR